MATIKVGDTVPQGKFATVPYAPELDDGLACGVPQKFTTDAWKGKKVVIFAVPGAFTPTCHANHLPPYIKNYDAFKAKGVDVIAVLSANDPFVLSGWTRVQNVKDKIIAVSDLDGAWSKELGLTVDLSGAAAAAGSSSSVTNNVPYRLPASMPQFSGNFSSTGTTSGVTSDQDYTGIIGEAYAYHVFKRNLPNFQGANWTSTLRTHAGLDPFLGESVADFTYQDSLGTLTEMLFGSQQKRQWENSWPTYYLEVKSSAYAEDTAFHISSSQLQRASEMTLRGAEAPQSVYVLVRVSSARSQPTMTMYPDPWRGLYDCSLRIVSDVEMAIPATS
ncbi:hypothetical protein NM688_g4945 [Phlebia brevispora]|uniref:Uncharacterized protein n=1 Tax=Phlebia brevispora TaxID=194682 RepID=A0ACC1T1H2_9APHY|nr:hypothetical protein NM688_g4945 [Phlebia brevispora]